MNRGIYLVILVLISGSSLFVDSRSVDQVKDNNKPDQVALLNKRISDDRIDDSDLVEGLQLAGFGNRKAIDRPQARGAFDDFLPYFGTFIYKGIVRRVLIKPMVRGFKRLIPRTMYSYYNEVLATRRVFKLMSPLNPAISSYTYNKFEQGIFWGLKRGWGFMADNFIEFEERAKRRSGS